MRKYYIQKCIAGRNVVRVYALCILAFQCVFAGNNATYADDVLVAPCVSLERRVQGGFSPSDFGFYGTAIRVLATGCVHDIDKLTVGDDIVTTDTEFEYQYIETRVDESYVGKSSVRPGDIVRIAVVSVLNYCDETSAARYYDLQTGKKYIYLFLDRKTTELDSVKILVAAKLKAVPGYILDACEVTPAK